mgnify:CR=1 FL=1
MKELKYYPTRHIANLKEMLETSCKMYSEKAAYLTKEFGTKEYKEIKYKTLLEDVNKLGTALINKGLKGKKIAVIGIGVSNIPLIDYLYEKQANVTVFDDREQLDANAFNKIKQYGFKYYLGKGNLELN